MNNTEEKKLTVILEKYIGKLCPVCGIIPLISCFLVNGLVYWGTQLICMGRYHYDFTTDFDRMVPFQSGWVSIYVLSYIFWIIGYVMAARFNTKDNFYRFVFSDMLSRIICMVIFIAVPTTNLRPSVTDDMALSWLMKCIYNADLPTNLFPSIHCLVSLMCFLGVYKSKDVSRWAKTAILMFAVLVFASTQFTKQHYIVDVFGGVIVALVAYKIGNSTNWYRGLMKFFDRINILIFGKDY